LREKSAATWEFLPRRNAFLISIAFDSVFYRNFIGRLSRFAPRSTSMVTSSPTR
jgi:hypothetical protein